MSLKFHFESKKLSIEIYSSVGSWQNIYKNISERKLKSSNFRSYLYFAKTYLRVAQRSLKLIQGLSQSKEKPCEPCCYTVTVSPLTIYANLLTSYLACEQLLFAKGKSSYSHNIFLCSNGKQSGGIKSVRN